MSIETRVAWTVTLSALAAAACGSAPSTSSIPAWNCALGEVPNGSAYQCSSSDSRVMAAIASTATSYTCPSGTTSTECPPPAEDAPPPTDDAGTPSQPPASTPPASDDASPPAEDSPPPVDAGTIPPADAGTTPPGDEDAGCEGASCNGNGHGNPHGNPPGKDNGQPDAGTTPPSTTPPGSTPPFTCTTDGTEADCAQPPTCDEGTHASACGACVPDVTTDDCVPPSSGGCWVTGGGFIQPATGQDSFGGNAMPMKTGVIRGEWQNVDHGTGHQMHGEPSYLYCRHVDEPGPGADNGPHHDFTTNQAYFGGPARFDGADGYWFDVVVDDHGEGKGAKAGGPDTYHVTIRTLVAPNQPGAVIYDGEGDLSGGNIQLHPPNNGHPYTGSTLPTWVSLQP